MRIIFSSYADVFTRMSCQRGDPGMNIAYTWNSTHDTLLQLYSLHVCRTVCVTLLLWAEISFSNPRWVFRASYNYLFVTNFSAPCNKVQVKLLFKINKVKMRSTKHGTVWRLPLRMVPLNESPFSSNIIITRRMVHEHSFKRCRACQFGHAAQRDKNECEVVIFHLMSYIKLLSKSVMQKWNIAWWWISATCATKWAYFPNLLNTLNGLSDFWLMQLKFTYSIRSPNGKVNYFWTRSNRLGPLPYCRHRATRYTCDNLVISNDKVGNKIDCWLPNTSTNNQYIRKKPAVKTAGGISQDGVLMVTMRCARRHARGHQFQRCRQRVGLLVKLYSVPLLTTAVYRAKPAMRGVRQACCFFSSQQ